MHGNKMAAAHADGTNLTGTGSIAELLNKAFMLFDYVEAHGDTFSIERRNKMAQIKQKVGNELY